jgi:chloride channel protein, CIC family
VCGNGQGLLSTLFRQNWFSDEILAILLLKLAATAATFGSGAVGGVFTPTLFIGAAVGMLYGRTFLYAFPGLQLDPGMCGIVGMGSFIAATTGAPLMSILMAFELTLDYTLAAAFSKSGSFTENHSNAKARHFSTNNWPMRK